MILRDVAALFCPADRPDRYSKALELSGSVIIDLEDAVAPDAREEARVFLRAALGTEARRGTHDLADALVRVNPLPTDDGRKDLEVLRATGHHRVVISKAEDAEAIGALAGFEVIALIETLKGLDSLDDIAKRPNCVGLMWGGDDFTADLNGRASRRADGSLLPHADHLRLAVLLGARRHGIVAIDGPLLQTDGSIRLQDESRDAAHMGFAAKAAIHPNQLRTIRHGFNPTEADIERARRIISASEKSHGGVARLDGLMVDGPVVLQARSILEANGEN
jgi:citrate lyase subunit beta/citryl-CoA lyase